MISLTVRNETPKNITAIEFGSFAPSADTISSIDYDIEIQDMILAPSASQVFNINIVPDHPTTKVKILAVVFEDGTGEGVPARLDFIKNNRIGRREQMRRIVPYWSSLLSAANKGNEQELSQLLSSTLAAASTLEETPAAGPVMANRNLVAQQLGLVSVKRQMVSNIQKLQEQLAAGTPIEILEKMIIQLKNTSDVILAKLEREGY
ncbi:MAG: hypothetical protein U0V70_18325 [Terriglobia bacterium]